MRRNAIFAAIVTVVSLSATAAFAQPNVIVNGDFESNPPPGFGNHVNYSISPWKIGPGDQSNVVKVDGPGGFNYGSDGPESDASAPGAGIPQHYLDIVGENTFYQSFTPPCSGEVTFGGSFSTRGNSPGMATVTLREGVGTSGDIVGQTNTVSLPGGNSKTDPWRLVTYTANINVLTTYSFVVSMDNSLNFDNGFVRYKLTCNPPNPCCPPWNSTSLESMLAYKGSGGIADPYTLLFHPTNLFKNQMQAYIDYVNALNSSNTTIAIAFSLNDAGTGTAPVAGQPVGKTYTLSWVAGGNGSPAGPANFFTLLTESMKVNRWYRVHTNISLKDGPAFFADSCANNDVDVRLQVQHKALRGSAGGPIFQIRTPDGQIVEKQLFAGNE